MNTPTKIFVVGMLLIGALGAASELLINKDVEVIKEIETVKEAVITEELEVDVIDSANAELERINIELDEEEARLLIEITERESRLERIRETRTSFQ